MALVILGFVVAGLVILVLGLVALIRCRREDIPEVLRAISRWFGHPDPR